MNPDPENLPPPDDVIEPPIAGLRELEQETSTDFVVRVRRKIQRRRAASQFASFSWHMPGVVLVEMAGIFKHVFTAIGGRKDPRP